MVRYCYWPHLEDERLKYTVTEEGQEAFRTHYNYNYVFSLKNLISGSTLSYTNIGQIHPGKTPHLDSKKNLIDLTIRSLSDEANIVKADKEYSYACASWLPVKAYYLLFNVMLTIEYLFTLDPQSFKLAHGKCSPSFTHKLATGDIAFSAPGLNRIYDKTIFTHREAPGTNLRPALMTDQHTTLAMKKIAQYKLQDWKRYRKISTFQPGKTGNFVMPTYASFSCRFLNFTITCAFGQAITILLSSRGSHRRKPRIISTNISASQSTFTMLSLV